MSDTNNINLNLFRSFIASAECGSFAKAGEKLGYSASNVSMNVSTLENQLVTQLFIRKPRKPLELTRVGQAIYDIVKRGFEDFDFALVIAESLNNIKHCKINIGCPSHITYFYLMERLSRAYKENPEIEIAINTESDSVQLIEAMKSNKINFAILDVIPEQYENDLEVKELKSTENIFVANKEIKIKDLSELNDYKYILSYDDRTSTIKLKELLKKYNVKLNVSLRCPTTEERLDGARYGIGIGYVMRESAKRDIEEGKLYEVKLPIKLPKSSLKIVYIKNHLTQVDKEFINKYIK